ncbi:MAG TPA: ribonuclease III [Paracoccaceae bacterium]|nr:ribonuclease III [Paracoccaceae bacterium]
MRKSRAAILRAAAKRIGHAFARPELLDEALTHASFASAAQPDNQRLEFLGDRVLGLVIAEALTDHDPQAAEGVLAPRLNALVRKETCAEVAAQIGLGEAIRMGRSELMTGGRRKTAILGDAMEAVIAAVYRDGGPEAARRVVLELWGARIAAAEAHAADAKSRLQEWAQGRGQIPPVYREVARSGPAHAPVFTIEVCLASGECATAEAGSKRAAEQAAAASILRQIEGGDG